MAKIELKNAQLENELYERDQKINKIQVDLDKNKTMQNTLSNLQAINGTDGNCKRCEALLIANGL